MLQQVYRRVCGSLTRRLVCVSSLLALTTLLMLSRRAPPTDDYRSYQSNDLQFLDRWTSKVVKSIVLVGQFGNDLNEIKNAFIGCPISECKMVKESQQTNYKEFDVVMMVTLSRQGLNEKLLPKPKNQIWISNHWESPVHNVLDTVALGSYINWSSSYRPESHLMTPYGRFRKLSPAEVSAQSSSLTVVNYAAGRRKKVAWFVSNCLDKNGRKNFAKKLGEFIEVDVYGSCGTLSCPHSKRSSCFEVLRKDYKFYLAFENSNCRYYMTEKLFENAYSNNLIPIVMGAHPDDYAHVLPPHSYIHVDSFKTPRDLADYLHRLDKDDNLYNEYFQWKSKWTRGGWSYWCQLCGLVHIADVQNYTHWYPEYTKFWDSNACSSAWKEENGVRWLSW